MTNLDKLCPDVNDDVKNTFTSTAVCDAVQTIIIPEIAPLEYTGDLQYEIDPCAREVVIEAVVQGGQPFVSPNGDSFYRYEWILTTSKSEIFNYSGKTIIVRDMKDPNEKMGNDIEVYLPDEALAVIQSMPKVDERIFPFNHRSVGANFQRLRAKTGFDHDDIEDNLRFHDLRHEGISWLFEKNGHEGEVWDIPKVAKVSGHKSWSSLQIYEDIISPEPCDRWSDWEWKTKVLD